MQLEHRRSVDNTVTALTQTLVLVGTQLHADGNEFCRVIRICKGALQGCFIVFVIVVPAVGAVYNFVVQSKHSHKSNVQQQQGKKMSTGKEAA